MMFPITSRQSITPDTVGAFELGDPHRVQKLVLKGVTCAEYGSGNLQYHRRRSILNLYLILSHVRRGCVNFANSLFPSEYQIRQRFIETVLRTRRGNAHPNKVYLGQTRDRNSTPRTIVVQEWTIT